MPRISVIIPTLNEEKYVGKLLDDLVAQTAKPDEVILADCNSDDKTVQVAESYKNKLPIKIVYSKHRSPGAARNAGARIAKSDYLLFIDADMSLPKDTITRLKSILVVEPVDFITPAFCSDGKNYADRYLFWSVKRWMKRNFKKGRLVGITGFMCVKRSTHNKIGGFNIKMAVGEDINYVAKLRKVEASYIYLDDLTITNSSRRFEGKSTIMGLLQILIQNSDLARWFFQPMLRLFGLQKKYGHYK